MAPAPTQKQLDETTADQLQHHPLDALVPDPAGIPPLCDEPQFAAILEMMVANAAPQLFAIIEEYGDRVDARIVAWGMAFADHAEVVSVEQTMRMGLCAPEDALWLFNIGSRVRARLVWFNPDAVTSAEDDAA